MSHDSSAYDLGNLDFGSPAGTETVVSRPLPRRPVARRAPRRPARTAAASAAVVPPAFDVCGSLSVFIPGTGQILRGEIVAGMFYLVAMAFLASLAWAILGTLGRLAPTLDLLGYPPAAAAWALCGLFVAACALHLSCVIDAGSSDARAPHPAVAAVASLVVPGWGQVLNGDRLRAALFLGLLWLAAAGWIMVSEPAASFLGRLGLYLPMWAKILRSPAARWTLPAIVWTLSVYDAASRAVHSR